MDPFIVFLIVVISILTILLLVVGIQVILILRNINKTLSKTNNTLDTASYFFHNITHPLTDVKALGQGVKTGLFVAEHVAQWLHARTNKEEIHERN